MRGTQLEGAGLPLGLRGAKEVGCASTTQCKGSFSAGETCRVPPSFLDYVGELFYTQSINFLVPAWVTALVFLHAVRNCCSKAFQ